MNKMKIKKIRLIRECFFKTDDGFMKFVKKLEMIPIQKREDIIRHEKAHVNLARKLGYEIIYKCYIEEDYETMKSKLLSCETNLEFIKNPNHLRAICLAPENPSHSDKMMATFPTYLIYYRIIKGIYKKLKTKLHF